MRSFEHASHATQGARSYQEDTALVWPAPDRPGAAPDAVCGLNGDVVAVLADGMGGHTGGALASRLACERFLAAYAESGDDSGSTQARLLGALAAANSAIAEKVEADPLLSGMGSTLVGVVFSDAGVEWVSVGDSPLLLYRRGEVAMLNEDHSLAPELDQLVAAGVMSEEDARRDPRRHMLRSAVTGEELELVDVSRFPLAVEPGDYVILASDGLHTLETGEIERIIAAYAADGPDAVSQALIRAVEAMRDPHQDNTTVVAVRARG
jgi:protein phosphatase